MRQVFVMCDHWLGGWTLKTRKGAPATAAVVVLLLLVLSREAPAQATLADSAQRLDTLAAHANHEGTPAANERALQLWAQAAALYRRTGNQRSEGRVLLEIGRVHWALSLHRSEDSVPTNARSHEDTALSYLRQGLGIAQGDTSHALKGRAFAYLGLLYVSTNHPDSGLAYFRQALPELGAAAEPKLEARVLVQLGQIYFSYVHTDSALVYYKRAVHIQHQLNDTTSDEALTLGTIANTYGMAYLPDSAIAYHYRALVKYGALGDLARQSGTLTEIALVHRGVGRPDSAMAYYRRALGVVRKGPHPITAREAVTAEGEALRGIGEMHIQAGRYDSAFTNLNSALASFHQAGQRSDEGLTSAAIGRLYLQLGRLDSALVYMNAVNLAPRTAASGGRADAPASAPRESADSGLVEAYQKLVQFRAVGYHRMEPFLLEDIGAIHERLGHPDSASRYYHQALALARHGNVPRDESSALFELATLNSKQGRPDSALAYRLEGLKRAREVGDRMAERFELVEIGKIHQRRSDRPDLRAARAYYDTASTVYAAGTAHAGGDANRVSITEQTVELSANWALAWLARAKEGGTPASALAAFAVSERGRAQGLLDLMRRSARETVRTRGVGAALTQPGADLAAEAEAVLAPLRRTHTAALTYLVTPDTLILWLLSPSGTLEVHERAVTRDSLVRLVQRLRAGLGADSARRQMARGPDDQPREQERGLAVGSAAGGTFAAAATQLGALLLPAEVLARLPAGSEVVLLPHDVLGLVPFAALTVGENELLGARYALRYAPSLAALNAAEATPSLLTGPGRAALFRQVLVVGNPTMPTVSDTLGKPAQLNPLPGAEEEAREIAIQLRTTALTGPAATEGAVRARLNTASLIHLATHGLAYGSDALVRSSYVALAPDAQHDGLFTVGELLDEDRALRLLAELVVLSACQTGLGDMKQAEGTVGLQRAYLAKGARTVLVSLWSVDDRATKMLMEKFYGHWLDDPEQPTKAEALRRAQKDVRLTSEFADPRYWAAFQLVGAR